MSRRVLLTGFEPFGPHTHNPSELLARSFDGSLVGGRAIVARVLPVDTRTLRIRLEGLIAEVQPDFIVGLGVSPGRCSLALERVAINVVDFALADAVGATITNEAIEIDGPDARLSTLPLRKIVDAWTALGVPGYVSNSAGTHLCNQWLYEALAIAGVMSPAPAAGFVHLPLLPEQAVALGAERTPSMTLELMRTGLRTALEAIALSRESSPAAQPHASADTTWIPLGRRHVER